MIALGWNLTLGNKLIHSKMNLIGISLRMNLALRLKSKNDFNLKIKYSSWQNVPNENTDALWWPLLPKQIQERIGTTCGVPIADVDMSKD